MRPVNKGASRKVYANYGDARHDLAKIIGYYCSYCEMKVFQSIEVEHILPQNQGGAKVDWDNFLLSCKYCNTIKKDHNLDLVNYLWPDRDNTDLAFDYTEFDVISPKDTLESALSSKAMNIINLTGIDRLPGSNPSPTKADTRWKSRKEVWDKAKENYNHWIEAPIIQMAKTIANCALMSGHYSIWREVFVNENMVLDEIDREYKTRGLYKEFDANGNRIIREQGQL